MAGGTHIRVCRSEDIFMPTKRDEQFMDEIADLHERIGRLDMQVVRMGRKNERLRRENLELKEKLLMVHSPGKE